MFLIQNPTVKAFLHRFPTETHSQTITDLALIGIYTVLSRLNRQLTRDDIVSALAQVMAERQAKNGEEFHGKEVCTLDRNKLLVELDSLRMELKSITQHIKSNQKQGIPHPSSVGAPNHRRHNSYNDVTPKVTEVVPRLTFKSPAVKIFRHHLDDHQLRQALHYQQPPSNRIPSKTNHQQHRNKPDPQINQKKSSIVAKDQRRRYVKTLNQQSAQRAACIQYELGRKRDQKTNNHNILSKRTQQGVVTNAFEHSSQRKIGAISNKRGRVNTENNAPQRPNPQSNVLSSDSQFSSYEQKQLQRLSQWANAVQDKINKSEIDLLKESRKHKQVGKISRKRHSDAQQYSKVHLNLV